MTGKLIHYKSLTHKRGVRNQEEFDIGVLLLHDKKLRQWLLRTED